MQIPCIERNVMGAVKALHAATLALSSSGKHRISLDEAIAAMRQIGLDMNAKYKETARGGLGHRLQRAASRRVLSTRPPIACSVRRETCVSGSIIQFTIVN